MANASATTLPPPPASPPEAPGGFAPLARLTQSATFTNFILACIIANAITLGVDAHFGEANPWHGLIAEVDTIFLTIFTVELALEFLAQGPRRYVRDGWNWFDLIVVALCYISAAPGIAALRTLRVLRVLRLVSSVPQMRRVVEALLGAMPGIAATTAILAVVFYIGAVMATTLFRSEVGFRDLGESALTLFQLTQFDSWGETIGRLTAIYPWAWAFLMGFTVIAAFAVLNLFIGVIVDAVQATRDEVQKTIAENVAEMQHDVHEIRDMKAELVGNVEDIEEAQLGAAALQRVLLEEVRALRAEITALKGERVEAPR